MPSVLIGSAFGQVVLVVFAGIIFAVMLIAAVAAVVWLIAGGVRATHSV
jgi:hypothetical protein